ncbi:hypothetical protein T484DRAFT_2996412 [Baffinella frigidus]|nr:hypothetical protein T484DRAFT_2996412 [Cryptophyta sp. CCMP2293]
MSAGSPIRDHMMRRRGSVETASSNLNSALHGDPKPKAEPNTSMQGGIYDLMRKGLLRQMGFYRDQLEFTIKVRTLFDSFDDDGSGQITGQELRMSMKAFDIQLSNREMQGLMARFDSDGNGSIDCTEFEDMVKDLIPAPEFDVGGIFLDQKLKATFTKIDTNGDGTLDKDELHEGLRRLGLVMKDDQLKRIMKAADTDGDGTLDYDEFCQFYSKYDTRKKLGPAELARIDKKWSPPDDVVIDSDPRCVPGAKVIIRREYEKRRGYRKFLGVGVLVRACVDGTSGRWQVKFPGAPETFLHTGRCGIQELSFVAETASEGMKEQAKGGAQLLQALLKRNAEGDASGEVGLDTESEEREIADFRSPSHPHSYRGRFWREMLGDFGGKCSAILAGSVGRFWREMLGDFGGKWRAILAGNVGRFWRDSLEARGEIDLRFLVPVPPSHPQETPLLIARGATLASVLQTPCTPPLLD